MIIGHIKEFFDKDYIMFSSLTPQNIENFYEYLLDASITDNTLIHYHQIMKQALSQAVRKDFILRSPIGKVDRPKKNKFM